MSNLAFPSAIGAGANSTGGRGGQIIHVTTLVWDAVGGLKEAIQTTGARIIVFDVSGEIDATQEGAFQNIISGSTYDNITIAGQTAPAGGITIRTSEFYFVGVSNIIIRYIRFRKDPIEGWNSRDATLFRLGSNMIFDHCTVSHGLDESLDVASTNGNITIQNCFLQDSKTGVIMGLDDPLSVTNEFTFVNNLIANISHRFPNTKDGGKYDIINNVVYNWKNRLIRTTGNNQANIVNNYYKPSINGLRKSGWFGNGNIDNFQKVQAQLGQTTQIYAAGSIVTGQRETPLSDDSDMFEYFAASDPSYPENTPVASSFFTSTQHALLGQSFTIKTANEAYTDVLADVGTNKTLNDDGTVNFYQDTRDAELILEVVNDTYSGAFYDVIQNIPKPIVPTNTRPSSYYNEAKSADIPEVWFDANVPSGQTATDLAPSGYMWIEEFVNEVDGDSPAPPPPPPPPTPTGKLSIQIKILISQ